MLSVAWWKKSRVRYHCVGFENSDIRLGMKRVHVYIEAFQTIVRCSDQCLKQDESRRRMLNVIRPLDPICIKAHHKVPFL
jgi:hypothetical protein